METKRSNTGNSVPSFAKNEAYNFVENRESLDIYHELSQIAEEIEQCRRKKL